MGAPDFPRALGLTVAVAPGASVGDTGIIELAVSGEGLPREEGSEEITITGAVFRELLVRSSATRRRRIRFAAEAG